MDILTSAGMAACGIVVGLLTGITGMGGILIPPFMIAFLGLSPHLAMGTSLASILPACFWAAWTHHRRGNMRRNLTAPLAGAGILCVFIGTELKALAPGAALNILLAALIIGVGAMTLRPPAAGKKTGGPSGADSAKTAKAAEKDGAATANATDTAESGTAGATGGAATSAKAGSPGRTGSRTAGQATGQEAGQATGRTGRAEGLRLAAVGGIVGVISGLTGAGGSVLTVPTMILMGYTPLTAVASGLAYVVAISAVGTVGNALHQAVDFPLAGLCAVGQILGVRMGMAVAGRLNARILRLLVAWVCVLTGVGILGKTLL